jgi:SAM-dependent methyltransferase
MEQVYVLKGTSNSKIPDVKQANSPVFSTRRFYSFLRDEVMTGNSYLDDAENMMLQKFYPVMMNPGRYPEKLISDIYVSRRAHAVKAILETDMPVVYDAGCGYGSETFLFASLGARVLSVDSSAEQITIAKKRQRYYEELFGRSLDITFEVADLEEYMPETANISLTWIASVLAAIKNQDYFLKRIYDATRVGGKVIITDMNLLNPLFLFNEWRRRKKALSESHEFARHANFWRMFRRKNRDGARYFEWNGGGYFDDVQFFSSGTLGRLLKSVGFSSVQSSFSGYMPPVFFRDGLSVMEKTFSKIPLIRAFGYFYLLTGTK